MRDPAKKVDMATERMRMREAIRRALIDELAEDPDVILLGEDIAEAGGAFKVTDGLLEVYGATRILDTPISEAGFLGAAVGAASTGLRPVVEIMFSEFIGVAFDQLVTEAAKVRYLSRGSVTCPLVVRATVGGGLGFGCQHSQVPDGWFRGTPGLKVVMPADAGSAYALMRASIRDDDPVVFFEHKALYGERGPVEFGQSIRLGQAAVVRPGSDATVVAAGLTVGMALQAAESIDASVEVIDLRTLVPWDRTTVLESVARTGRLVTVEEGPYTGGWGTEIISQAAIQLHSRLVSQPLRITCPDVPVPFATALEARYMPTAELVAAQVTRLLTDSGPVLPWWIEEQFA
jgi:pyruvate/2-oxoglutarate/acetoin dehydrogenase E1 component